ncbi:MAG: hypothetical protein IH925_07905, partial [Proteobacteria bacterium]|nr:hypothetical protein [Pseudomonadota bacterium]
MTAVVPPSPPTQPPAPPAPQPAVVVPDPPVPLTRLSPGARLDGIVLAQDVKGQVQIQTSLGTLAVQTNVPLPRDAAVVLVVQSLGPQVQLQIVSIDGRPPVFADGFDPASGVPRSAYTVRWHVPPRSIDDCAGARLWWVVETDHPDCPILPLRIRHECTG